MTRLLITWVLCSVALLLVAQIFSGIRVKSFGAALIATFVIALINMLIGTILHILALPITIITLGLFALVINGFLFWVAGALLKGFDVKGGWQAIGGSIVYSILVMLIHTIVGR